MSGESKLPKKKGHSEALPFISFPKVILEKIEQELSLSEFEQLRSAIYHKIHRGKICDPLANTLFVPVKIANGREFSVEYAVSQEVRTVIYVIHIAETLEPNQEASLHTTSGRGNAGMELATEIGKQGVFATAKELGKRLADIISQIPGGGI